MPQRKEVTVDSLLSRCLCILETGCIEWQGAIASGYGRVSIGGKKPLVHRVMYQLLYPEVDITDLQVCHKCDNPKCIRPEHLFHGTRSENMLDCSRKGRLFVNRAIDPKFDPQLVEPIKQMLSQGMSKRAVARELGWAWSSYREFEKRHSLAS